MADIAAGGPRATFDFGRVVGQTFSLIGRNFVLFALLAVVFVGIPQFGVSYAQRYALASGGGLEVSWQLGLIGWFVGAVTTYVLQGAVTRAAIDDLSGAGVKFGAAIADGFRYLLPLFIVAILVTLGTWIGLLLLVIPGIILALRWSLTAPIVVVERDGPTKSMGRSAELTEGHRWAIFGLAILYVVLFWVLQMVLASILAAFGESLGGAVLSSGVFSLPFLAASAVMAALLTLISTVGTASLYFELRRVKEGVGVEQLAAVFD